MKTTTLLILLSFTASIIPAYANEPDNRDDDIKAYCTEQAQLDGIEDAAEMSEYLQDCIDSYTTPAIEQ